MKAYIVGGGMSGTEEYNGVYHLVTEDGVCWATQWCSSFDWAMKDLYEDRKGLQEDWKKEYGDVKVLRLGEDGMTFEKLLAKEMYHKPAEKGVIKDGIYYSIVTVKNGHWTKSEPKPIQELGHVLVDALIKENKNK